MSLLTQFWYLSKRCIRGWLNKQCVDVVLTTNILSDCQMIFKSKFQERVLNINQTIIINWLFVILLSNMHIYLSLILWHVLKYKESDWHVFIILIRFKFRVLFMMYFNYYSNIFRKLKLNFWTSFETELKYLSLKWPRTHSYRQQLCSLSFLSSE